MVFSNQTQRFSIPWARWNYLCFDPQYCFVIASVCELLKTNFVVISFSDIQAEVDGGGIIMSNSNRWATFSKIVL